MGTGQTDLTAYGAHAPPAARPVDDDDQQTPPPAPRPRLGFESRPSSISLPDHIATAREADWIVFTGRYPYVFDAARLGFAIGHREDASYQWTPDEVTLPVHFLDNNFHDANLSRFVDRVFTYEPEIAVLGDIYAPDTLDDHLRAADLIWDSFPEMDLILVPKCDGLFKDIPPKFILGYPNGASTIQATDVADYRTWRTTAHSLHILGGTPLSTYEEICALTRENVTGDPPADIAGLDWNGYQRYAEDHGDYAAADGGWHRNLRDQYLPKRDLIRYSLLNAKHYWISVGVWPDGNITDLPLRAELLDANRQQPINLNACTDQRELLLSPPPHDNRRDNPIYRTDETQAEIIEPLSPLSTFFGNLTWTPDGVCTGTTTYQTPQAHHAELTCSGCGAHITAEPDACAGTAHPATQSSESAPQVTIQLVSYEHHRRSATHDYDSVSEHGPKHLPIETPFPQLHAYCSEGCRTRTEYRSPELLVDLENQSEIDGVVIGRLTYKPNS